MSTLPPAPQPAVPSTTATPVRIERLTLTDFRAFPGPAPTSFELQGKNLLVYGENGAGKSSLFYALSGFFAFKPPRPLGAHKNVFSGLPDTNCKVTVEFVNSGAGVDWTTAHHPGSLQGAAPDIRVTEAALRRACLDYRALLDTNYKQGNGPVNLFDIAVEHLLRDYQVTVSGGTTTTIGDLWTKVLLSKPTKHSTAELTRINQACLEFNSAFRGAFPALVPLVNDLMELLGWQDLKITRFDTPGLTYKAARFKQNRVVEGQLLTPVLSFLDHPLLTPQLFLNEARLSALGLAIYLAGRLACTPTATTAALKLLVLDDVLIGLDHSNRLPVLDVLNAKFADWQIILLTHDRVWFEMARFQLGNSGKWQCVEIFEGKDIERGIPAPTIRATGDKAAKAALDQARAFLISNHIPAAANYARAAFELALKSFCERFGVPVAYKSDPRHLDTEKLLSAVEAWLNSHSAKVCLAGVIERIKLFRKVVLNPYSHASPPNIARAEVAGAISAIDQLLAVTAKGKLDDNPIEVAQELIATASPSAADNHAALGFLRAAFFRSLHSFCHRKQVHLALSAQPHSTLVLWHAVFGSRATLFPPPHDTVPVQIDTERRWLISPISESDLLGLTRADLMRLQTLLVSPGNGRLVLDLI
mgnify:CR=1 FL=1